MSASRRRVETTGSAAAVHANVSALQAQAAMLVPGMRHARSLLDAAIRVLEYFEKQAVSDCAAGGFTARPRVDPVLLEEAERVAAMLSAFRRLS